MLRSTSPALRVSAAIAVLSAMAGGCGQILGLDDPRDPPDGSAGDGGGDGDGSTLPGDGSSSGDSDVGDAGGDVDTGLPDDPNLSAVGACFGDRRCAGPLGNSTELCDGGLNPLDAAFGPCPAYCIGGQCIVPQSCEDATGATILTNCGPSHDESCCAATGVPGGTFFRSYDGVTAKDPSYPATISTFTLDRFEVTVGRFRRFVADYAKAKPAAGAGKNPHDPSDPGWNPAWPLPANAVALVASVKHPNGTWTDTPDIHENSPITYVDWFTAFAFCIWDGGRLPTEAEWNYAAAGGGGRSGQRVYPWSVPSSSQQIDPTRAIFDNNGYGVPAPTIVAEVGSTSPQGDSRWGQSGLAGNATEWVLDWLIIPYPQTTCTDCATTSAPDASPRGFRGGSFIYGKSDLTTAYRDGVLTDTTESFTGFRCARPFR